MTAPHATEPPRLGHLLRDHDRRGLRFERHLRHAPQVVWTAITDSEHLRAWLPTDIVGERRSGAPVRLPFWPEVVERFEIPEPDTYVDGEIVVYDPPITFAWNWGGDLIRFELASVDDGTLLTLTTWLGPAPVEPWQAAAGWHACLDHLGALLDHSDTSGVASGDPTSLEPTYQAAFGPAPDVS